MATIIKLTNARNGKEIYLNVDSIILFREYKLETNAKTIIEINGVERVIHVTEAPEKVMELIRSDA